MLPLIGPFKYFLLPGKKGTVILKKYVNMKKMRPNNVRRTVCLLMYKSFKVLVKTLWTFSIVDIRQNELYLIIDNSWKINKGQTSCRGQCNIQLQGRLHQKRAKRYKWYLKNSLQGRAGFFSARRGPKFGEGCHVCPLIHVAIMVHFRLLIKGFRTPCNAFGTHNSPEA